MKFVKRLLVMSLMSVSFMSSVCMFDASALNVGEIKSDANTLQEVEARGFTRNYKKYLRSGAGEVEIMSDTNWNIWVDNKVEVTVKEEQPSSATIRISVYYKNLDGTWQKVEDSSDLQNGWSDVWHIPEDAEFKVTGELIEGESATYGFTVSLSSQ